MKIKEWWAKLKGMPVTDVIKHKHKFVVMDTDTFKEKFSFQLSGINLFVTLGATIIGLILLTTVLIAFTPLREWIPGYTDTRTIEQTYANARRLDSLETQLDDQEWLISTLQAVLRGEEIGFGEDAAVDSIAPLQQIAKVYRRTKEDSLLRAEVEREDNRYQVKSEAPAAPMSGESTPAISHLFFPPLKGKVLQPYDAKDHHLGIDIAGTASQTVYAAYGGTVVSASYTAETGYVVVLQHPGNVITVYSNNAAVLRHQGDAVRAGEPIAYVGSTGMREQGPHLHFELWLNGLPVNPEEYISF